MTTGSRALVLALAVGLLGATGVAAHDYWLAQEPATLRPGDTCSLRLLVGDRLEPELERPLQREITTRYDWVTGGGSLDLLAELPDGTEPVFRRELARDQTALLVMDRGWVDIDTTYGRFAEFLDHEEATEIARTITDVPADRKMKRRYARNLKALVRVGAGDDARLWSRKVGQKLEVLLLDDPRSLRPGRELGVRVLFEGEPLEGQLVKRFVGGDGGLVAESKARTDADGTVRFAFDHPGLWVVRVGYLRRCGGCEGTVWDTHYATFSLQVPGAAAGAAD